MKTKFLWSLVMAFVMMFTLAIAASAQDRDDQNRDRDDQNRQVQRDDNRADNNQWQNRNGWEYRTYQRDQRPEGWNQGKVTNRTYCENHKPCYTYQYQGTPYYYYNDNGSMIVRRQHRDDRDHDHDHDNDHR